MKILHLIFAVPLFFMLGCINSNESIISNSLVTVKIQNSADAIWVYQSGLIKQNIAPPVFEIDGKVITGIFSDFSLHSDTLNNSQVIEYSVTGSLKELPDVKMILIFRMSEKNPFIRFRYILESEKEAKLTKSDGNDKINFFSTSFEKAGNIKEIRLSEFNDMVHSFCLSERDIEPKHFSNSSSFMGPLLISTDGSNSFLIGYEHGSQVPDRFLEFRLNPDRSVALQAVKGNYYNNYQINKTQAYKSIWFEAGAVAGDENLLAATYRDFVLHYMSPNSESRKPYIFYNTWNFQERNRNWYKKPYLADMTLERMLKEIDIAHQMGIEVFVIDAGWFEKTGDWSPSLKRFTDGLKTVKSKLDGYEMKLGLWFDPNAAALSSKILKDNRDCVKTWDGKESTPHKIWETEESHRMCLVSLYRDAFADELIRCAREYGVTYFKWDAIGQYGCNDPGHFHGNENNTPEDRAESFAFEVGNSMGYVVDKLCAAVPEAIVDFDITEGNRSVGLGFLASGKYFLINNGPYFFNYDIPFDRENGQWNIFFYPGTARTWICRTPLTFDKWIPTSLFLTHYLPDDPYENQSLAVGSLILGQNGIWGDLPQISKEGVEFFGESLGLYKQVRDDMTETAMIRDGAVGGSPEVYEKINSDTRRGAIVIFSSHSGSYESISQNKPQQKYWSTRGVDVSFDKDGHAVIKATFEKAEAKIIFFGVNGE